MSYPALSIANYLLQLAEQDGQTIDPMKMQKLIYFCHGWNLSINKAPLIKEAIQAWRYGPVVPSVYGTFKKFGNDPITEPATRPITALQFNMVPYDPPSDQGAKDLIRTVWDAYGKFSGVKLSNLTHEAGSPWQEIASKFPSGMPDTNVEIPNKLIQGYFQKLAGNDDAEQSHGAATG